MKIFTCLVTDALPEALAELTTSLFVQDGEVCHITVVGRRFLTPLPITLPNTKSEGVYSVEMATEPIEDWRILFLDFLPRQAL